MTLWIENYLLNPKLYCIIILYIMVASQYGVRQIYENRAECPSKFDVYIYISVCNDLCGIFFLILCHFIESVLIFHIFTAGRRLREPCSSWRGDIDMDINPRDCDNSHQGRGTEAVESLARMNSDLTTNKPGPQVSAETLSTQLLATS